jgi:phosphomannomutase
MIEYLANSGFNKLSELVISRRKKFGEIFYDRIDLHYDKEDRMELLEKLFNKNLDSINKFKIDKVQTFLSSRDVINGIKFKLSGNNRWLLLRSSETEPIIRIYVEAESDKEVEELLNEGKNLIFNQ